MPWSGGTKNHNQPPRLNKRREIGGQMRAPLVVPAAAAASWRVLLLVGVADTSCLEQLLRETRRKTVDRAQVGERRH